jgi:hypothetical protein
MATQYFCVSAHDFSSAMHRASLGFRLLDPATPPGASMIVPLESLLLFAATALLLRPCP